VNGGSGRIGAVLVRELLSRGHEVVNLDLRPPPQPTAAHYVAAVPSPRSGCPSYSDRLIDYLKNPQRIDGFATHVHVSAAVRAYALALERPRAGFEA
jgi:nucleoside-diphosphate-sugar epimerase